MPASASTQFQSTTRRLLRDMHVPEWDERFLSDYDPDRLAAACEASGLNAVMIYAKSHLGLCTYPTQVGRMHPRLEGRDVLGELNEALRRRGLAVAAYQSITFDNFAAETHPEWAQVDQGLGGPMHGYTRYGVCCPNNADYRAYELGILEEILTGYAWDALWLDMIFFLAVCSCDACRDRFRREDGLEIPAVVDWTDPTWAAFQQARRRWISELTALLVDRASELRPGIAVTHNLANALSGWRCAQPLDSGRLDTYTSMDLYGDRYEQLVVTKMALHLSRSQPAELMVSLGKDLIDHVSLKSSQELAMQGLAASAVGSAFIVIDGIEPDGREVEGSFAAIGETVQRLAPFEAYFGGTPVEDVAIYFSDDSFMDFADNGTAVSLPHKLGGDPFPHVEAVRGAARALSEAHIAFGVVTSSDLDRLGEHKVLVLPNVSRTSEAEVAAFRAFVEAGGRLYASGYTSLVDVLGERHADFALADVFGVSCAGEEQGRVAYLQPLDDEVAAAVWPQHSLSHPFNLHFGRPYEPKPLCTAPRLAAASGEVLATLTLPYSDSPDWGSVDRKSWASIHAAPPWERTGTPVLVRNRFGAGTAVYSAFDLETSPTAANRRLFTALVEGLLGDGASISARGSDDVWLSVFDQAEESRLLVTLLSYSTDRAPGVPTVTVVVPAWADRTFGDVEAGPGAEVLETRDVDGRREVTLRVHDGLAFVLLGYGRHDSGTTSTTPPGPHAGAR